MISRPFDAVREETLAQILCYLPLADLLRAGQVSRRWRYEIHERRQDRLPLSISNNNNNNNSNINNNNNMSTFIEKKGIMGTKKKTNETNDATATAGNHLWERVDASSFVQETYEKFLGIGKKRRQLQQQQHTKKYHQENINQLIQRHNLQQSH